MHTFIRLLTLMALMVGASAHAMENHEELGQQLRDAAERGSLVCVGELLQQGAPVYAKGWWGQTPLMIAARYGRINVCQLLLDHKASVDAKDKDGWNPLMYAASYGHTDLCQLLLDHGASVNAKDCCGGTPLSLAAFEGHTDTCQLLLNNKASVDATNNTSATPLVIAAYRGHTNTCRLLLDNKASVDAKNIVGSTPLMQAADQSHTNICHLLIDTIVTQIKNNKANAVVLLGLKKYYLISYINPIDKNVIRLIAREVHASALRQQESLFAQIDAAAKNDEFKQEILAYARKQLSAKSTNNQGNSDE